MSHDGYEHYLLQTDLLLVSGRQLVLVSHNICLCRFSSCSFGIWLVDNADENA